MANYNMLQDITVQFIHESFIKMSCNFYIPLSSYHIIADERVITHTGLERTTVYAIVAGCVAFVLLFLVIFVIFIKRQRKKMEKLRMYYFYQGDYKVRVNVKICYLMLF